MFSQHGLLVLKWPPFLWYNPPFKCNAISRTSSWYFGQVFAHKILLGLCECCLYPRCSICVPAGVGPRTDALVKLPDHREHFQFLKYMTEMSNAQCKSTVFCELWLICVYNLGIWGFFSVVFILGNCRYLEVDMCIVPLDSIKALLDNYSCYYRIENGDYLPSVP